MILTVEILLEVKKARLKYAKGFYYNTDMQIESNLLHEEIKVLEEVLKNEMLLP